MTNASPKATGLVRLDVMYATRINLRHNCQALSFSIVVSAWSRLIVKAFGGINVQASMGPHEHTPANGRARGGRSCLYQNYSSDDKWMIGNMPSTEQVH